MSSIGIVSGITAAMVAKQFVEQYCYVLEHHRHMVHRFYKDGSLFSHPDADGKISSVSTIDEVRDKVMSMRNVVVKPVLKTVDAQWSLGGGVMVLVRGSSTGTDNIDRDFIQTFFLAPQDNGFYVLNDIFRYEKVEDDDDPRQQSQQSIPKKIQDEEVNKKKVYSSSEINGEGFSAAEEKAPSHEEINHKIPNNSTSELVVEPSCVTAPQNGQRRSYTSILKTMNSGAPTPVPARAPTAVPNKPPTPSSNSSSASENKYVKETETDAYSICVKNLPFQTTTALLEKEFKKFGPVKPNGVKVRSNSLHEFCYGFVEFEVSSAVQDAIQASPIMIGGRKAYVQEKRTTGWRGNNGGRFAPATENGGFCNYRARARGGGYGGGRGYDGGVSGGGRPRGGVGYARRSSSGAKWCRIAEG